MAWLKRDTRIHLALVCLSTLTAVLGMEIFFRCVGPKSLQMQRNDNTYRSFTWDEAHSQFDEVIGFITKPHLDVAFENIEYRTNVRTNSWGFRDDESSLVRPDILLLGDSFLFGWGVQESEMAASIVEQITGDKVLNLGAACYGTVQEFLLLQRYCEIQDATGCELVVLYYINDRIENGTPPGQILPSLRKNGQSIVFTSAREEAYNSCMRAMSPSALTTLSSYSAVLDLMVGSFFNPRRGTHFRDPHRLATEKRNQSEYPGIDIGPFEVLEYLLRLMSPYLEERNIRLTFVLLPYLEQFEENDPGQRYAPEKEVLRMLEIPHSDFTGHFEKNDFYPIDRHLNPKGQEKLGHLIAQVLGGDPP